MSIALEFNVPACMLVDFLLDEHAKDTGIPVHPYSVVRSTFEYFERRFAITNDVGTLFHTDSTNGVNDDDPSIWTAYGANNDWIPMCKALRSCGVHINCVD